MQLVNWTVLTTMVKYYSPHNICYDKMKIKVFVRRISFSVTSFQLLNYFKTCTYLNEQSMIYMCPPNVWRVTYVPLRTYQIQTCMCVFVHTCTIVGLHMVCYKLYYCYTCDMYWPVQSNLFFMLQSGVKMVNYYENHFDSRTISGFAP